VDYLNYLQSISPEMSARVKDVRHAVRNVLSTHDGAILLDLLEKSTVHFTLHPETEPRALDALNAQRMIALDFRRIASDDVEHLPQRQTGQIARSGTGRGTT
jgi:hypothetical protein